MVTLLTALLSPSFGHVFHIGPDVQHVPMAVFLCGFSVAVGLPLAVFEGCLAGYERYDLINIVEIFTTIARVALTVWLIQKGYGILGLAIINFRLDGGERRREISALLPRVQGATSERQRSGSLDDSRHLCHQLLVSHSGALREDQLFHRQRRPGLFSHDG